MDSCYHTKCLLSDGFICTMEHFNVFHCMICMKQAKCSEINNMSTFMYYEN